MKKSTITEEHIDIASVHFLRDAMRELNNHSFKLTKALAYGAFILNVIVQRLECRTPQELVDWSRERVPDAKLKAWFPGNFRFIHKTNGTELPYKPNYNQLVRWLRNRCAHFVSLDDQGAIGRGLTISPRGRIDGIRMFSIKGKITLGQSHIIEASTNRHRFTELVSDISEQYFKKLEESGYNIDHPSLDRWASSEEDKA